MFGKRQERLSSPVAETRGSLRAGSRIVAASLAISAIVASMAGTQAIAAQGPNDIQSGQLGPDGENPCPDAGPEQEKTDAELCTLGYGPDGKLGCVNDDGAPDDLTSCEPDQAKPDVEPCGNNGGDNPGDGDGDGDGGEGGNGGGGDDGYGDNGGGGGGGDGDGDGGQKPEIYPSDRENSNGEKEPLKLAGGVPVPTRIDTGAGGTARPSAWLLFAAPAMMLIAIALRTFATALGFVSRREAR